MVQDTRPAARAKNHSAYDSVDPWLRDVVNAKLLHRRDARERLSQDAKRVLRGRGEMRDITAGDFIPPAFVVDQFTTAARAARPFAGALQDQVLPEHGSSVVLPAVVTGASVATHTDLGSVSETDPTTGKASAVVVPIVGQVDMSRQAFDHSSPGWAAVVLADLAADYNAKLDQQCLTGSGVAPNATGVFTLSSGVVTVTYTDASPSVPELWAKASDLKRQVHEARKLPAEFWLMTPKRWAWIRAALDANNDPIYRPEPWTPSAIALAEKVGPENTPGVWLDLPVVLDVQMPTTLGGGTEDAILCVRGSDLILWEQARARRDIFMEVLSSELGIRIQVTANAAFMPDRYTGSIGKLTGTGLTSPAL